MTFAALQKNTPKSNPTDKSHPTDKNIRRNEFSITKNGFMVVQED
jgi:hypothetical protein